MKKTLFGITLLFTLFNFFIHGNFFSDDSHPPYCYAKCQGENKWRKLTSYHYPCQPEEFSANHVCNVEPGSPISYYEWNVDQYVQIDKYVPVK